MIHPNLLQPLPTQTTIRSRATQIRPLASKQNRAPRIQPLASKQNRAPKQIWRAIPFPNRSRHPSRSTTSTKKPCERFKPSGRQSAKSSGSRRSMHYSCSACLDSCRGISMAHGKISNISFHRVIPSISGKSMDLRWASTTKPPSIPITAMCACAAFPFAKLALACATIPSVERSKNTSISSWEAPSTSKKTPKNPNMPISCRR